MAALTEKLGLNEPLLTQYLLFLKQIFTLDFGNSFTYQMPVSELLASRFPVTLALTLMSTVISLVISLPLGYFAGVHKDVWATRWCAPPPWWPSPCPPSGWACC